MAAFHRILFSFACSSMLEIKTRRRGLCKPLEDAGDAYLQLLHPVLTFGLLVLGRFCFVSPSCGGEGRPIREPDVVDIL